MDFTPSRSASHPTRAATLARGVLVILFGVLQRWLFAVLDLLPRFGDACCERPALQFIAVGAVGSPGVRRPRHGNAAHPQKLGKASEVGHHRRTP